MLADSTFTCLEPVKYIVDKPYKHAEFNQFAISTQDRINAFFQAQYAKRIFSGTYLFHKNDSMYRGHEGYANFARRDSFIDDDLFQLASVSKTFTGTAVMILVQEGKLAVEDSVHWYLPELKRKI